MKKILAIIAAVFAFRRFRGGKK